MSLKAAEVKRAILDGDDFGHEMRVGRVFFKIPVAGGMHPYSPIIEQPLHGGTYIDPITGKPRQFDYRCRIHRFDQTPLKVNYVLLAVECKNVDKEYPLVVCGRPRTFAEAYHVFIESKNDEPAGLLWSKARKVSGAASVYQPNQFVGKSVLRLNRDKGDRKGQMKAASDPDIYDRWSQALASSVELAESACFFAQRDRDTRFLSVVLPVVVLPDESLWTVSYDDEGLIHNDPCMVNECEFFVERTLTVKGNQFVLSHIHFVTLQGFFDLLSRFTARDQRIWFQLFGSYATEM